MVKDPPSHVSDEAEEVEEERRCHTLSREECQGELEEEAEAEEPAPYWSWSQE